MYKKILLLGIIICGISLFSNQAYARYSGFMPAMGDVLVEETGYERALVTEDGKLELWSASGEMMAGFPVLLTDATYISSPVFADVTGDGQNEIIVIIHDRSAEDYVISAFDQTGQEFVRSVLETQEDIYFDPIVMESNSENSQDIGIINIIGTFQQLHYSVADGFISVDTHAFGQAAGVSIAAGGELLVNYPTEAKIDIYTKNELGLWSYDQNFELDTSIIYPLVDDGLERFYSIDRNGALVALHSQTGEMITEFPVDLSSMPRTSPILLDVSDEYEGDEIVVQGENRKQYIVSRDGVIIEITEQEQSFVSGDVAQAIPYEKNLFGKIGGIGISFWNRITHTMTSMFASIRMAVTEAAPEMHVFIYNDEMIGGENFDLGAIPFTDEQSYPVSFRVENNGNIDLIIDEITCEIESNTTCTFKETELIIPPQESKMIELDLAVNNLDPINAGIIFETNDPTYPGSYGINILATPQVNFVVDGNMEDPVHEWRRWSRPHNVDYKFKTDTNVYRGAYASYIDARPTEEGDVHAGIQQLNIPVEAGKSYRFSFRYKLLSGELFSILGVRSSNIDMGKAAPALVEVGNAWQFYERTFIVPSNYVDDFRVRISVYSGEVYLDDITITEIPALSIVRDGDFESDNVEHWSGWGRNTNWRKVTSTVYAGDQSLEIGNVDRVSGGMYQNNIPLDSDKLYQFSFKYNVGSGVLYTIIGDNSANKDVEGLTPYLRNTHGEWKEYTRIISGSVFTTQNPLIRFSTRNGISWIDDVEIIEIDAPVMIIDGDMENEGLGNWENYSNALTLEKTGVDSQEGVQSLYVQTTSSAQYNIGGVQYRNIFVEAGKTYTLSFYYKVNGSLIPRLGINDSDTDFELTEMDVPELDPSVEWALYTRTFTVPQDFTGDFRLVYRLQSWYVDGVEEIEYEGQIYEAPHHEFVGNGELWVDNVFIESVVE